MFRDLGIEVVQPDWDVIEAGAWTMAKVRKNMLLDYGRLYQAFQRNDPDPAILLRSDTEVPDSAEVYNYLTTELVKVQAAGFRRVYFEAANEPNNAGYDLERWQVEGPKLVADWISVKLAFPNVKFISPAMMPMLPGEATGWHLPSFAGFPILGQHTYHLHGRFFWTPYNLNQLFPGKPIWVTEFNDTEPKDRLPYNITMLETLATMPYVDAVTFFCAGEWNGYGLSVNEATTIGEWFKSHKEQTMWKDRLPNTSRAFKAEGGAEDAFESIIQTWITAGGDVEESALRYLVGTRRLKATQARLDYLTRKGKAAFQELNDAVQPYLPL